MEITVIGYHGGSAPSDQATSSYLLQTEKTKILLDCGAGSLSQLQKVTEVDDITNVLITHYHYDHFSDIGAFIYNRLIKKSLNNELQPLSIYTQRDKTFSPTFDMGKTTNLNYIDETSVFNIGDVEFSFMVTKHPVKCLAVKAKNRGRTLVYTADSSLTMELINFAKGANVLITECSLYSGFSGEAAGHMNTEDVATLINKAKVGKTLLTHLPIYGNHENLLSSVQAHTDYEVMLAEKFKVIQI